MCSAPQILSEKCLIFAQRVGFKTPRKSGAQCVRFVCCVCCTNVSHLEFVASSWTKSTRRIESFLAHSRILVLHLFTDKTDKSTDESPAFPTESRSLLTLSSPEIPQKRFPRFVFIPQECLNIAAVCMCSKLLGNDTSTSEICHSVSPKPITNMKSLAEMVFTVINVVTLQT